MKKQNKENFKPIKNLIDKQVKTLLICSSNSEIDYVYSNILDQYNHIRISRFYDREILPYDHFSTPDDIVKKRINEIFKIPNSELILTSVKNLFEFYPEYSFFDSLKTYSVGEKISISDLKKALETLNYIRVDKVKTLNEYSHRGGIIDINSGRYKNPVRIDFFDDYIESIREFDIKSQRSISEVKSFKLNTGYEILLDNHTVNLFKEKWRDEFHGIDERTSTFFTNLTKKNLPEGYENYLPILIEKPINFFNLIKCDEIFITNDSSITNYSNFIKERFDDEDNGSRELIPPSKLFYDPQKDLVIKNLKSIKLVNKDFSSILKTKKQEIIQEKTNSYVSYDNSLSLDDLVIHENYGLGIFRGLKTIKTSSKINEYLCIEYKQKELLYVPTNNFHMLSKFHKKNDDVTLDSLSNTNWSKKKEKAKARIYDHASEILEIESERLKASSYSLKVSDEDYLLFLKDFPFEDTDDQRIVSSDIRKDLSLVKPMNRLLCGDVGFGKTEIAIRSAFITVYSEKQVIILSPSTVLTEQHYESFTQRFRNFPVTIKKLSRNTSIKEKQKLYDDFNNKKIDLLIGTHALFNENLSFENVGLIVVDEEHRFGAKQKNLIKHKQLSTHILYMSATPIPKTMNMAFSGLKDFSFLSTPPPKRLSIKTFLEVSNNAIIKESLNREFNRDGCSFFIENNVEKMEKLKTNLSKLLPNQEIGIVHASLNKKTIDKRIDAFRNKEINVLICTTIVEMGLDIPEANTIIINNAQNFGLSQLHQLRGRIGRSSRQGYCYALIPSPNIGNKSKSRLKTFVDNSHLGAGFNIAEEDLEIRGAGEILGIKQSGHIDTIGMSLYMSMLKTALNNDNKNIEKSCEIKLSITNLIPENYLPSPIERLKVYKKLSIATFEALNEIKLDLLDKCGKHPQELKNLFQITELAIKAKNLDIKKITQTSKFIKIGFLENVSDNILETIIKLTSHSSGSYQIKKNGELWINYADEDVLNLLNEVINEF